MIEAQNHLMQLRAADFPTMKEEDRGRHHRRIHELAYPKTHTEVLSIEELAERIRAGG